MSASFRKIDYSIRPAKHAERRMLCEIFRRLRPFGAIEDYVYVGMGSVWFSDFILFHRALGIKEMVSIERSDTSKDRFEANKPYRAVTIDFRDTSQVLPELDWQKNHYIWLDYDDPLRPSMLQDAKTISTHATSGTLMAVSVQCQKAPEFSEAENDPEGPSALSRFKNTFGRARVFPEMEESDLYSWRYGNLIKRLFISEIEAALNVRNAGLAPENKIHFRSICNIEYEDGAKMITVVGAFYSVKDTEKLDACNFASLDFKQDTKDTCRISVPKLTLREIRHLERQLPSREISELRLGKIPVADAQKFAEFYRYLPNFVILES